MSFCQAVDFPHKLRPMGANIPGVRVEISTELLSFLCFLPFYSLTVDLSLRRLHFLMMCPLWAVWRRGEGGGDGKEKDEVS